MSYWNEPRSKERSLLVIVSRDGKLLSCVALPDKENPFFEIFAKVWQGNGEPVSWQEAPESWFELWPHESLRADNPQKADELQEALLMKMESGYNEEEFDKRPSPIKFVDEIKHPSKEIVARIYLRQDTRYEVQYYAYTPGNGGGWVPTWDDICTYADTLEDAREVAQLEIKEVTPWSRRPSGHSTVNR